MSTENGLIQTIGFEGPNRVGKGLNMQYLQKYLYEYGTPHIILKGDGSRPGTGSNDGDPISPYWQRMNQQLHNPNSSKELWNHAAYILSREFLIWKKVYMPRMLENMQIEKGVIILDRSILSRTLIPRETVDEAEWKDKIPDLLYQKPKSWKGQEIKIDDIAPDIILLLIAPLETLFERLDVKDPKYEFRKRILINRYGWYIDSIQYIPEHLKSRITIVNTNRKPDLVFNDIRDILKEKQLI